MRVDIESLKFVRLHIDFGEAHKDLLGVTAVKSLPVEMFCSYSAKDNEFYPTALSTLFSLAMDYYTTYTEVWTHDQARLYLSKSDDITYQMKQECLDVLGKLHRVQVSASEYEYLKDVLVVEYTRNKTSSIFLTAHDKVQQNPEAGLLYAQAELLHLQETTRKTEDILQERSMSFSDFIEYNLERYAKTGQLMQAVSEYGWSAWDNSMGGLFAGELTLFAGPPSSGKSYVCSEIAYHNALQRNKRTIYGSNELTPAQIWARFVTRKTGIPNRKFLADALTEEERELFIAAMKSLQKDNDKFLILAAVDCMDVVSIRQQAKRFYGAEGPELIVVDHMTRMRPYARGRFEGWQGIEQVAKECKQLALDLAVPVISPSHLNRAGNDTTELTIDHVQYQALNQIADNIFLMWADDCEPVAPPKPGEWVGQPGRLNVKLGRSRSAPKDLRLDLLVEFSLCAISSYTSTRPSPAPLEAGKKKREKKQTEVDVYDAL